MDKILSSAMAQEKINELVARKSEIANSIDEKRASFEAESDVEKRDGLIAEVETLTGEMRAIEGQVSELEETRKKFEEQEKRMSMENLLNTQNTEARKADVYATEEYRNAWINYVITGKDNEVRALTTDAGSAGVVIPTELQKAIETAWEENPVLSMLTPHAIKGYFKVPVEMEADEAVWHTEGTSAPEEEEITFGEILLSPKMLKKWISWTDELASLAPAEFMAYIKNEVIYRVLKKLADSVLVGQADGNGNGVEGIVGNDLTIALEDKPASFNVINEALAELLASAQDGAVIFMHPRTFFNEFMGLTDTTGRPIYNVGMDNTGKPVKMLNGLRVILVDCMRPYEQASTGYPYAIVGNLKGYFLNTPNGKEVKTTLDVLSLSREDKQYLVGKIFAGGNVTKLKHFVTLAKDTHE